MRPIVIAPSLLAADFARLGEEVRRAEAAGADWLHLDIMDGHFVPNLTIGPPVVEKVRKVTRLPLDCHLMVTRPERLVDAFLSAGADGVTFHIEAVALDAARVEKPRGFAVRMGARPVLDGDRVARLIERIRGAKKRVGIALNPDTPAEALAELSVAVDLVLAMTVWPGFGGQAFLGEVVPKIGGIRRARPDADLQVDGGLDATTVRDAAAAGANVIVAGTSTFRAADMRAAVEELRRAAKAAAA